jgi:monoamine oxidase
MPSNLPQAFMRSAAALPVAPAGKIGFQAERFWETQDNIYGGISWTTDLIDQIWYPSHDYLSAKGILTGGYIRGSQALEFNRKPVAERLQIAREQGERLHPGYAKAVEHGIALGWERMQHQQCAWADEDHPDFQQHAEVLAQPQGRFHVAGDQITYWSGWQEGAILAAWHALNAIDRHVRPTGGG